MYNSFSNANSLSVNNAFRNDSCRNHGDEKHCQQTKGYILTVGFGTCVLFCNKSTNKERSVLGMNEHNHFPNALEKRLTKGYITIDEYTDE